MANEVNNVATALTTDTFTRAGFTFAGWNTVADGVGYRLCGLGVVSVHG